MPTPKNNETPREGAAQHTAGPWEVRDDNEPWTAGDATAAAESGEQLTLVEIMTDVVDASGDVVARLPWWPLDASEVQASLRANARLIAAAPDLLATIVGGENGSAPMGLLDIAREFVAYAEGMRKLGRGASTVDALHRIAATEAIIASITRGAK